jgi:hypothetical protein
MPQVCHLSLEEAKAALDAVGIPYRISRAQNRLIPEGDLISIAPVPRDHHAIGHGSRADRVAWSTGGRRQGVDRPVRRLRGGGQWTSIRQLTTQLRRLSRLSRSEQWRPSAPSVRRPTR